MARWVAVVCAVATLLVAAGVAAWGAGGPASTPPQLPRIGTPRVVDADDVGDPYVLTAGGTYYLFGTTDWRSNVPAARSTDLIHWQQAPDALPVLPRWAAPTVSMTWAPAVISAGGRYVMYVATEERATGRQCVAVATSNDPQGPYASAEAAPFLCQESIGGSIDPSVARDGHGGLHLVWKNNGNCCGQPTYLWEQDLTPDGMHLSGTAHRLLGATEPWERGNVEGPSLVAASRGWWLFFSGGDWRTADYATGLAWCQTAAGPCQLTGSGPFLPSSPAVRTPSGLEAFRDAHGHLWAAFTTTEPVPGRRRHHVYENRVLDVAPVQQ